MRTLLIAMAIALGGCAAQRLNVSMYNRIDGAPIDAAKQQAAFAHCRGEAVSAPLDPQGRRLGAEGKDHHRCLHGAEWLHSSAAVSAQAEPQESMLNVALSEACFVRCYCNTDFKHCAEGRRWTIKSKLRSFSEL